MARRNRICIAFLVSLCLLSPAAHGTNIYKVVHKFDLSPGGNMVPACTWFHRERASAFQKPPGQRITIDSGPLAAPIVGVGALGPSTVVAAIGNQIGTANSQANITTLAVGRLAGTHQVDGSAVTAPAENYDASAWSGSSVVARAGQKDAKGRIKWGRFLQDTISGGVGIAKNGRGKDPVSIQIYDLDTEEILSEEVLFSLDFELGDGSLTWGTEDFSQPDRFEISSTNAHLTIDCNSQYVPESQRGSLGLRIIDGSITEWYATGIFAGYDMPEIVGNGTFMAENWTNEVTLDYELPTLPEESNTGYQVKLGGEGEAFEGGGIIPEPSGLVSLAGGLGCLLLLIRRRK